MKMELSGHKKTPVPNRGFVPGRSEVVQPHWSRCFKYTPNILKSNKKIKNYLQLADLVAYPVARFVIEPKRANPAFDLVESKIYEKGGKRYGLKIYP